MERESKKLKLSSQEAFSCRTLNIDDLPEEVFIKIFGYLKYEDLCRVGWVSKKWHAIARCPVLWRRVDVHFSKECGSMSEAAIKFIQMLPACVTHLRLSFEYSKNWILDFTNLTIKLQERCPNLHALILHRARLAIPDYPGKMHLSEQLMSSIQVLAFHHCVSAFHSLKLCSEDTVALKIEVLDISRSILTFENCFVSKMLHVKKLYLAGSQSDLMSTIDLSIVPHLEVLDLEGSVVESIFFQAINNFGVSLVELYLCFTSLSDKDLILDDDALPRLQKLCVRLSSVTYKGVAVLLKTCKSLQHVIVGDLIAGTDDDYSTCSSEKVKVFHGLEYCDHYTKVDYMHV